MAEIIDEYIALDDRIPDSDENQTTVQERTLGEAVSDVAGNMIDTLASGGKPLHILGAGLQAGFNTEGFQEKKQRRANAARLAELQLQDAETRLQQNQFNLEQAKINAPIATQIKQQDLQNAQMHGRNLALQYEYNQQAKPHQLASLAARAKAEQFQTQQIMYKAYDQEAADYRRKTIDGIKKMVNFPQLNIAGQYVVENNPAVKALGEMAYLMHIYNDPDKFNYQIRKLEEHGWYVAPRDDGELELQSSSGGKSMSFVANPEGLKNFSEMVQNQLKDVLTTARIIGTDAVNPGQATAKIVLSNPVVKQICGNEATAYRVYSDLFNKKILNKKSGEWQDVFSPEQKMYHMSNILIGSALEDNMFNDAEKTTLLPQVQQMIKALGGELKLGESVDNTFVVWGRNQGYAQTYTIKDFLHNVLREKDVISPAFGEHLQLLAKQMKKNQSAGGNGGESGENPQLSREDFYVFSRQYGDKFKSMDPAEQLKLIKVQEKIKARENNFLRDDESVKNLSLGDLRILDNAWKEEIEKAKLPDEFFSPYQNEIFLRERDDLYAQKAPLIEELKALEEKTSDYSPYGIHGRRGPSPEQRKIISLRNKINGINDKIKMREKKLSARKVSFKEYK